MKNVRLLLFMIAIASLGFQNCSKPSPAKPNIILIMADDLGYSDIGCYGGEIETPNLDRIASQGMRFRTFYNMAKCNPTRPSLLTGLYNGGDGAVHIATLAKQAGYQTIMTGKEHFDSWVPEYCYGENACPYTSNDVPDVQPGPANSFWTLRAAWANASNTPFRYFKQYGHEGGSNTPFIAYWPVVQKNSHSSTRYARIIRKALHIIFHHRKEK